ncbi:hypothetical protein ACLB2K_010530 [Fragaria x ananassa]|uniref:uncharacterized protein LOC105349775 n=1 Tax=Fragaria vesca subsp. vesca TaxID=101020 RepID=UPI0005C8A8B0|nr:PREDICTED: uncharacterized protein LOC105349775 [Fragaria vesca subsp. vesca]
MLEMAQFPYPCFGMERNNMELVMMRKQTQANVDVSPFLLFEDSGDSEAASEVVSDVLMAEDDAESCSWDSADVSSADELIVIDDDEDEEDDRGVREYRSYSDDHEEEGEEEEVMSSDYQRWGHQLKSTVSVDSTKEFEMLNEVEKSKLFWETCLAS